MDFLGFLINQRSKNHVDVIGHHNRHIERHLNVVVMQAAVQHDLSGEARQSPPLMSAERYKMRPIIVLDGSEEHTSELQSLTNLVCRLLLEKKKKRRKKYQEAPQR